MMMRSITIIALCCLIGCKERNNDTPQPQHQDGTLSIVLQGSKPTVSAGIVCDHEDPRVLKAKTGDIIELNLELKAPEGLSQYKIDIHHNFDCHAHRMSSSPATTPWKLIEIKDIDGISQHLHKKVQVPENAAAGNYHFMFLLIDKKGNEATPLIISIQVTNSEDEQPPLITLRSPQAGTHSLKAPLLFDLEASDNEALDHGRVEITYLTPEGLELALVQQYFPDGTGTTASFSYEADLPPFLRPGNYTFHIDVFDARNNQNRQTLELELIE